MTGHPTPHGPPGLLLFGLACLLCALSLQARPVPPQTGPVTDRVYAFDATETTRLVAALDAFRQATGSDAVVLAVRSLDGEDGDAFAARVATDWELGVHGPSLLLVLAPVDGQFVSHTSADWPAARPIPVAASVAAFPSEDRRCDRVIHLLHAVCQAATGQPLPGIAVPAPPTTRMLHRILPPAIVLAMLLVAAYAARHIVQNEARRQARQARDRGNVPESREHLNTRNLPHPGHPLNRFPP